MKRRALVHVSGLVQGIGYRPFVYRLAIEHGLAGYVANLGDAGVRIDVSGEESAIKAFLRDLVEKKPPIARYTQVDVRWLEYASRYSAFEIAESDVKGRGATLSLAPPDISICSECLADMSSEQDRRYLYPFTCCALCGPRFTLIKELPYDRERTTMDEFPFCFECEREFYDPADRRFNAQTTCCPKCGPRMTLYDYRARIVEEEEPIREAAKLLEEGWIVAIKGIGGIHLAVKASEDEPVARLRKRRRKPNKPFAIMSPDLESVRQYAVVSKLEEELLTSWEKPIIVLRKREPFPLSELLAPGLHTIGVMLPYSGIHALLFRYSKEVAFVMTSANYPDEPMIVTNDEAFSALKGVADYFLLHDRRIWARCDDSVVKVVSGSTAFLRRSRGYTPLPIELPFEFEGELIAVGAELTSTAAVLREGKCFTSQHIGDVESLETCAFLDEAIQHLCKLVQIGAARAVICDLHPRFTSRLVATRLAKKYGAELIEVQHHHAHLASLMVESGVKTERAIGIACDGVGYGVDGTAWGGEILLADYEDFKRLCSLEPYSMPGGDLCAYWYGRMLQAILYGEVPEEELREFLVKRCLSGFKRGEAEVDGVFQQLSRRFYTPTTTSTGRLLDAASCLLGVCFKRTYEGGGAMKLEALAHRGDPDKVEVPVCISEISGRKVLRIKPMMAKLYEELLGGSSPEDLAAALHEALAEGLARLAIECARQAGVDKIGFTGGVAYNELITRRIKERVREEGFEFLQHRSVPCGDGGISIGQIAIGAARLRAKRA